MPAYFFLDGTSATIGFQFTTAAARYDAGGAGFDYLVDVVLVNEAGAAVDYIATAQHLDTPYFVLEDYVPGCCTAWGASLVEGWYAITVMEYREGYVATSHPILMTTTPFPTPRPTPSPTSPAPSLAPTSIPTSRPTEDTIHAEITITSPERAGRVIKFTTTGSPIQDGLVWSEAMSIAVSFTGDTHATGDALVTVRVVSGDGASGVSGVDPCGVIATTLCLGEPIANGEPMRYNASVPWIDPGIYRLSLVWIPYDDRPNPPATYVCTGEFLVVDAFPTRKPTAVPAPAPTELQVDT